jgi:Flp pilus assembly secretin CpaC
VRAFAGLTLNDIDMISEPEVVCEDAQEARIQIGRKWPIITITRTASGESYSYTYQDVSNILTVTPTSQKDGTIRLAINPQLNEIGGQIPVTTTLSIPIIDNREARTSLFVKNGGVVKIGGLMRDRTVLTERGVPVLMSLPLVGFLFRNTVKNVQKLELTIVVSPHIVDYAQPHGADSPHISGLEAELIGETDVKVDWSRDIPIAANGIQNYRVYRDTEPILSVEDRRPLAADVQGDSTYWIDASKKKRGREYFYVVTAVNPSGMEQACPKSPEDNASIVIPDK